MNELEQAKYRIESLERLVSDAYDMAGQRGKGACIHIRSMLKREAEKVKARRVGLNAQRTSGEHQ